ncbi:MAG: tetratricopeptide repeat protein [Verrucomicrobia bacterium]|nr:tetratricopeptide repeat protein [Verrucomicrobiota bacterium]
MRSTCCRVLALIGLVCHGFTIAAPREAEWIEARKAVKDEFPETAAELLGAIESGAFADKAWAEGAQAIALRIAARHKPGRNPGEAAAALAAAIPQAPPEARPPLKLLEAWWFSEYAKDRYQKVSNRSVGVSDRNDDPDTWDWRRLVAEQDRRFQAVLADREALLKIPIGDFDAMIEKGDLPDSLEPTLYDFIAKSAVDFYRDARFDSDFHAETFHIGPESPALRPVDGFLAWQPLAPDSAFPMARAARIYQSLLSSHRADPDSTAFHHWNLERLRWANDAAVGDPQKINGAFEDALLNLIRAAASNPVSADARLELANVLTDSGKYNDALAILKEGAAAFPDHPFGRKCDNEAKRIIAPSIEVETPTHWTGSDERIAVEHTNVSRIWFRAYRQPWKPSDTNLDSDITPVSYGVTDDPDKALANLLRKKPDKSWDAALPDPGDHSYQTTRLLAPDDLAPGYYVLVSSGRSGFDIKDNHIAVMPIHVTRMTLVMRRLPGRHSGLVCDARTGGPLAGVTITCHFWAEKKKGLQSVSTKTDKDGAFSFRGLDDNRSILVAESGNDRAVMRPYLWMGSDEATAPEPTDTLLTDRAIYRPGQTVHFKGILWGGGRATDDLLPIRNAKTSLALLTPDDKELQRLVRVTNEFGSVSGSFTLPAACRGGVYRIVDVARRDRVTFRVEEYKRLKFTATIAPPAAPACLGKPITLTGMATAYTGAPLGGADVRWSVKRSVHWPRWLRGSGFAWNYGYGAQIARGTTTSAADGSFGLTFTAMPDPELDPANSPIHDLEITADVTEPSGETRTVVRRISVAETLLAATIDGDDWLPSGKPVVLSVNTATHDGIGCQASGKLTIHRLREPANCTRSDIIEKMRGIPGTPGYPLANLPDPAGWEPGEAVSESDLTTSAAANDTLGIGDARMSLDLPPGPYRAIFTAKDANGREFRALRNFQVVDPAAERFPTKRPFFTVCDRDSVNPGETVTLAWGSGHPAARACVEWHHGNKLVRREWSAPGRTQQIFSFTPDKSMRSGISVTVTQTTLNSLQQADYQIEIPWVDGKLELRWEHITSKLVPGAKETWTAIVTRPNGSPADAEMVATLYDASLDAFVGHHFPDLPCLENECPDLDEAESTDDVGEFDHWWEFDTPYLDDGEHDYRRFESADAFHVKPRSRSKRWHTPWGLRFEPFVSASKIGLPNSVGGSDPFSAPSRFGGADDPPASPPVVAPRRNLSESAFFVPHLTTDDKGAVRMSFTMPEALTTWRFLGLAHDRRLRSGLLEGETVTAKDLMIQPNPPRFLREGDTLAFTARISNQSDREQAGTARLALTESATQNDVTAALGITAPEQSWTLPPKQSRTLSWRITVPDGTGTLTYRATATAGALTDGEEAWLPVLPRRVLLTESMSLPIRDAGKREFVFQKLADSATSPTLQHRHLQVQSVSEPAWYALLALPYLMEFPHECAEQTFHRYYANALAQHLVTSRPRLRKLLDQWRQSKAVDSPLANQPPGSEAALEETPWLTTASNQTQARQNLSRFFDDTRLTDELDRTLAKVVGMQRHDGLWPWFQGGPGSEHITCTIVCGFARLREAGVKADLAPAVKALAALDAALDKRYREIIRKADKTSGAEPGNTDWLSPFIAEYLYARTLLLEEHEMTQEHRDAFRFFVENAGRHWPKLESRMSRAQIALALHRLGETTTPKLIIRSLRETATVSRDTGMEWKDSENAWDWWMSPLETQAMMIELFREVARDDRAVEDLRAWLITRKQTADWGTTTATADAVHALLFGGRDLLAGTAPLQVLLGGVAQQPGPVEPGTGFHQIDIAGPAVRPEYANIALTKSTPGVAWAAVHWQYFEDIAKVSGHGAGGLNLEKSLYVRKPDRSLAPVNGPLKVGDELVTRLILRTDRPMEFVHLKDERGSGTEPLNVLSGYRWQDGFGYFETTRDTASHFFIDALPAGTHVFETGVRVQHAGTYQSGIATIRCMYAPAFASHSGSVPIAVTP